MSRGEPAAYHGCVNRLLLVFMIVLLPLRGWAGDLMSVQMAVSGLAPQPALSMPAGCPMHTPVDAAHAEAGAESRPVSMASCDGCDLCVPMAEQASTRLDIASFAAHAQPPAGREDFASAALARALQPPIS